MGRYKKPEIEISPQLIHKLFEHVKRPEVTFEDIKNVVYNLTELSKCDEMLTLEEFDLAIQKPMTM